MKSQLENTKPTQRSPPGPHPTVAGSPFALPGFWGVLQMPILIPCHRVIRSSGDSGNYGGGQLLKEWLLSHEKLQKEKLQKEKKPARP